MSFRRFSAPIGVEDNFDKVELTAAEKDLFEDIGVEGRNMYDEGMLISERKIFLMSRTTRVLPSQDHCQFMGKL